MSDCILWEGFVDWNGYGKTWRGWAHRIAYSDVHGEIPKGMHVMHLCNNKRCVNVDHLKLGTAKDNAQAASRDGLLPSQDHVGQKNPNVVLRPDEVFEIRSMRSGGWSLGKLAKRFGVSRSHISRITKNKAWKR